ncbi:hypothetical protein ABGT15_13810 [Flavobacterium enshiense]|uniref:hypothetical protein n=1 Tax=Flavobacterium enshiense TaxID=1341165 RepID=UPI00345CB72A
MGKKIEFTNELLSAIAEWQKGTRWDQDKRRDNVDLLIAASAYLPVKYKTTDNQTCYRKRFLNKGELIPILEDGFIEGITSYSLSLSKAKEIARGELVNPDKTFCVIFFKNPKNDEVIINLNKLFKSNNFKIAVARYKKIDVEKWKVLDNFQDKQQEVILKSKLHMSNVYQIAGKASTFEGFCDLLGIKEEDQEQFHSTSQGKEILKYEDQYQFASVKGTQKALDSVKIRLNEILSASNKLQKQSIKEQIPKENSRDTEHYNSQLK